MRTPAGGAAAIDLCLHLVRGDHGSAVANRVARLNIVAAMRDGGQAQFVYRPVAEDAGTSTEAARARMLAGLDRNHALTELAAEAHMSVRISTRRFRQETGVSAVEWLNKAALSMMRAAIFAGSPRTGTGAFLNWRTNAADIRASASMKPSTPRVVFRRWRGDFRWIEALSAAAGWSGSRRIASCGP
ncbi:hypothetical protein [Kitasatospora sp. GAS1066B]|uniref:hypothetical protein n=1 Tax=Kitasatospora sp. GAS1066B TaxID=3156271 RepID=UPI0035189748